MEECCTPVKESLHLSRNAGNVVRACKYEAVTGKKFGFYPFKVVFDVACAGIMADIATDAWMHFGLRKGNKLNLTAALLNSGQYFFEEPSGIALHAVGTTHDCQYL